MHSEALMDKAIKIKEKYAPQLLSIPGVIGVGVGGRKRAKIIVSVRKLTEELRSKLPSELEGIPVEIVEVGAIEARSLYGLFRIP